MSRIIAAAFFVFILSLTSLANAGYDCALFNSVRSLPHGDKLTHFLLFGLLTLMLNHALRFQTISFARIKLYAGTTAVAIFVLAEEFSQIYFPSRSFDLRDLAADSAGIFLFTFLTYIFAQSGLADRPVKLTRPLAARIHPPDTRSLDLEFKRMARLQ